MKVHIVSCALCASCLLCTGIAVLFAGLFGWAYARKEDLKAHPCDNKRLRSTFVGSEACLMHDGVQVRRITDDVSRCPDECDAYFHQFLDSLSEPGRRLEPFTPYGTVSGQAGTAVTFADWSSLKPCNLVELRDHETKIKNTDTTKYRHAPYFEDTDADGRRVYIHADIIDEFYDRFVKGFNYYREKNHSKALTIRVTGSIRKSNNHGQPINNCHEIQKDQGFGIAPLDMHIAGGALDVNWIIGDTYVNGGHVRQYFAEVKEDCRMENLDPLQLPNYGSNKMKEAVCHVAIVNDALKIAGNMSSYDNADEYKCGDFIWGGTGYSDKKDWIHYQMTYNVESCLDSTLTAQAVRLDSRYTKYVESTQACIERRGYAYEFNQEKCS